MADNDQSKIRYDDFINSIVPDPAKPESMIMLSGFVGHGPEGHVRVYPDPTLGTWYDIPEADVVHSLPIADSKLGGSYIWARSSAAIKPGNAAAPAAPAPEAQPQALAAAMQPTPATRCFVCPDPVAHPAPTPTAQTHCFVCPPLTAAIACPTHPVVCDTLPPTATQVLQCGPVTGPICPTQAAVCDARFAAALQPTTTVQHTHVMCQPQPTPTIQFTHVLMCQPQPTTTVQPTHFFICPTNQSLPTVCTQIACPTQPAVCLATQPVVCGILPPSFGCTQQGCGQGAPQPGGQQQGVQAMAAVAQPSVHICATPSAVGTCGPVHESAHICPTPSAVGTCGPVQQSAHICPTPSAVGTCGPVQQSVHICPTPSAVGQCGGGQTWGTWVPPCSLAMNGVFTPFGR
jgi:hypothetical protein